MSANRNFNKIIHDNQIDIKSKSIKSWLRIFNSNEKIKAYGFDISNAERFTMLKGLKAKQNKSKKRYSRRVR
jgi:hypothetical protein